MRGVFAVLIACSANSPPPAGPVDDLDVAPPPRAARAPASDSQPAPMAETRSPPAPAARPEIFAPRGASHRGASRRIDLNFRAAPLEEVLRMLATVGGVNLVIAPGINGAATLVLKNVRWDRALEVILRAHGLEAIATGDILLIRKRAGSP